MAFWILSGLISLAVAGLLVLALLRGRRAEDTPAAAYDLEVYRQQLRDLDRDVARRTVTAEEADRLRAEISRRILAADAELARADSGQDQPRGLSRAMALVVGAVLVLGTALLYGRIGAPGLDDYSQARRIALAEARAENRPTQAQAEAEAPRPPAEEVDPSYLALVEQLRAATAGRPQDLEGQRLLVEHEARLGNFAAAANAQQQVIALLGAQRAGARAYSDLGELMVMAAGGYVSPEAEGAFGRALERDESDGRARYYLGLMLGQVGRPDRGYQIWADTLRRGPAGAPWIRAIEAQIPEMADLAGVNYRPIEVPGAGAGASDLPGPSAADVDAASELDDAGRAAMIEGMVSGLAQRLATEGGSAQEWARLISALGVMGRTDQARTIHQEARAAFADDAAALELFDGALAQAGIAPGVASNALQTPQREDSQSSDTESPAPVQPPQPVPAPALSTPQPQDTQDQTQP